MIEVAKILFSWFCLVAFVIILTKFILLVLK
jgi:hypothetical protein